MTPIRPGDPRAAPACPECGDHGFVLVEREGRTYARRCRCVQRERRARLWEACQVPERHSSSAFESFDTSHDRRGILREGLERSRRFADAYPVTDRGILYMGPAGVGKTHLAVAVLRALVLDKGVPALFVDYATFLKRIQDTYSTSSDMSEMDVLRPVLDIEVLLLDDLGGARPPSPWTFDVLFHVLNTRYNRRRTTILTTNFLDETGPLDSPAWSPEGRDSLTSRVGVRLRSRLYEMCDTVLLDGPDWRRMKAGTHP